MKTNLDPIVTTGIEPEETGAARFWAPALVLASLACWGLLLGAAKLVAALV